MMRGVARTLLLAVGPLLAQSSGVLTRRIDSAPLTPDERAAVTSAVSQKNFDRLELLLSPARAKDRVESLQALLGSLEFVNGQNRESLGLTGREVYSIAGLEAGLKPRQMLKVRAEENGSAKEFDVLARIDTPEDVEYIRHGGVLPYVLRSLLLQA